MKIKNYFFSIFLSFSLFVPANVSAIESPIVSLEKFLSSFGKTFRGESFAFTPLCTHGENLVIVQLKAYSTTGTASIPELIQLMSGGTGEFIRTILIDDPNHFARRHIFTSSNT